MWGHTDRQLLLIALHLHRHRNRSMVCANGVHHLLPRLDGLPINRNDAVVRHEPRLCSRIICKHLAKNRRRIRRLHPGKEKNAEKKNDRQDKIHRRSSKNHNHAGENRFAAIAAITGIVVICRHAGNIIEAPQWNQTDRIDRLSITKMHQTRPKADSKFIHTHPGQFCRDKMPQLVHKDEQSEDKDCRSNFL